MPWIKLDDQWIDHPKIIDAGRDARDVWLASLTYCARHLTDGLFHPNLIPQFCVMAGVDLANCQEFAKKLLEVCLWEDEGEKYYIHDYLEYNPTKKQTEATRLERAKAGRAGGNAKASKLPSKKPGKKIAKSYPVPVPPSVPVSPPVSGPEIERALTSKTTQKNEKFDLLQEKLESVIGFSQANEIESINELLSKGVELEDIQAAADWYIDATGKQIYSIKSLMRPIEVEIMKRKQGTKTIKQHEESATSRGIKDTLDKYNRDAEREAKAFMNKLMEDK